MHFRSGMDCCVFTYDSSVHLSDLIEKKNSILSESFWLIKVFDACIECRHCRQKIKTTIRNPLTNNFKWIHSSPTKGCPAAHSTPIFVMFVGFTEMSLFLSQQVMGGCNSLLIRSHEESVFYMWPVVVRGYRETKVTMPKFHLKIYVTWPQTTISYPPFHEAILFLSEQMQIPFLIFHRRPFCFLLNDHKFLSWSLLDEAGLSLGR